MNIKPNYFQYYLTTSYIKHQQLGSFCNTPIMWQYFTFTICYIVKYHISYVRMWNKQSLFMFTMNLLVQLKGIKPWG